MRQLNEKDVDLETSLDNLNALVLEEREMTPQSEARRAGRLSYYFGVHQRFYMECVIQGLYTTVEEKAQFREKMFEEENQLLYDYRAAWMSAFNG